MFAVRSFSLLHLRSGFSNIHKYKILRSPQQVYCDGREISQIGNNKRFLLRLLVKNFNPDEVVAVNLMCIYKLPAATFFPAVNVLINEYFLRNISRSVVRNCAAIKRLSRGGSESGRNINEPKF